MYIPNLQGICACILPAYYVSIVCPQHHKRWLQLLRYGWIRGRETQLDQLRLQYSFSNGCLHHICAIQTIHAVHSEYWLLVTDYAALIAPMKAHGACLGTNSLNQCRNILKAHAATGRKKYIY